MSDVESAGATGDAQIGAIPWKNGTWKEVVFQDHHGDAFTEGDILLGSTELVLAREAALPTLLARGMVRVGDKFRWPKGRVPFQIAEGFPEPQRVRDAIAHWYQYTRIRFIERTGGNANQYPDYLLFVDEGGCWSYVGRQGGEQKLSLSSAASVGNAIHEMGHAVGLWHEQSRHDRDEYVEIFFDNIQHSMASQFRQVLQDGQDLGRYDFDSVMHYPRTAFSKNGAETIRPKQPRSIGQRERLSEGDIAAIQALYASEIAPQ